MAKFVNLFASLVKAVFEIFFPKMSPCARRVRISASQTTMISVQSTVPASVPEPVALLTKSVISVPEAEPVLAVEKEIPVAVEERRAEEAAIVAVQPTIKIVAETTIEKFERWCSIVAEVAKLVFNPGARRPDAFDAHDLLKEARQIRFTGFDYPEIERTIDKGHLPESLFLVFQGYDALEDFQNELENAAAKTKAVNLISGLVREHEDPAKRGILVQAKDRLFEATKPQPKFQSQGKKPKGAIGLSGGAGSGKTARAKTAKVSKKEVSPLKAEEKKSTPEEILAKAREDFKVTEAAYQANQESEEALTSLYAAEDAVRKAEGKVAASQAASAKPPKIKKIAGGKK